MKVFVLAITAYIIILLAIIFWPITMPLAYLTLKDLDKYDYCADADDYEYGEYSHAV